MKYSSIKLWFLALLSCFFLEYDLRCMQQEIRTRTFSLGSDSSLDECSNEAAHVIEFDIIKPLIDTIPEEPFVEQPLAKRYKKESPIEVSSFIQYKIHNDEITSLECSFDGKTILTGSRDGTACLWKVKDGKKLFILQEHTDEVTSVAFSRPDGQFLITGSEDKRAFSWDAKDGASLIMFKGHTFGVSSVASSYDGNFLLTGSFDKTARIWHARTGRLIRKFEAKCYVQSVAFHPDRKSMVTGLCDGTIRLWDVKTGEQIGLFKQPVGWIKSVKFRSDGKRILSGDWGGTRLWNSKSGKNLTFLGYNRWASSINDITSVAFSPNEKMILSGALGNVAHLWEVSTGNQLVKFVGFSKAITAVAFSPDGRTVFFGSDDKFVHVCDISFLFDKNGCEENEKASYGTTDVRSRTNRARSAGRTFNHVDLPLNTRYVGKLETISTSLKDEGNYFAPEQEDTEGPSLSDFFTELNHSELEEDENSFVPFVDGADHTALVVELQGEITFLSTHSVDADPLDVLTNKKYLNELETISRSLANEKASPILTLSNQADKTALTTTSHEIISPTLQERTFRRHAFSTQPSPPGLEKRRSMTTSVLSTTDGKTPFIISRDGKTSPKALNRSIRSLDLNAKKLRVDKNFITNAPANFDDTSLIVEPHDKIISHSLKSKTLDENDLSTELNKKIVEKQRSMTTSVLSNSDGKNPFVIVQDEKKGSKALNRSVRSLDLNTRKVNNGKEITNSAVSNHDHIPAVISLSDELVKAKASASESSFVKYAQKVSDEFPITSSSKVGDSESKSILIRSANEGTRPQSDSKVPISTYCATEPRPRMFDKQRNILVSKNTDSSGKTILIGSRDEIVDSQSESKTPRFPDIPQRLKFRTREEHLRTNSSVDEIKDEITADHSQNSLIRPQSENKIPRTRDTALRSNLRVREDQHTCSVPRSVNIRDKALMPSSQEGPVRSQFKDKIPRSWDVSVKFNEKEGGEFLNSSECVVENSEYTLLTSTSESSVPTSESCKSDSGRFYSSQDHIEIVNDYKKNVVDIPRDTDEKLTSIEPNHHQDFFKGDDSTIPYENISVSLHSIRSKKHKKVSLHELFNGNNPSFNELNEKTTTIQSSGNSHPPVNINFIGEEKQENVLNSKMPTVDDESV